MNRFDKLINRVDGIVEQVMGDSYVITVGGSSYTVKAVSESGHSAHPAKRDRVMRLQSHTHRIEFRTANLPAHCNYNAADVTDSAGEQYKVVDHDDDDGWLMLALVRKAAETVAVTDDLVRV